MLPPSSFFSGSSPPHRRSDLISFRYFPEYTGGSDVNKAAKYILWRFMQANRARLSVYPQYVFSFFPRLFRVLTPWWWSLTQATDTTNIRLVFAAVKETILQNALKDSGILWFFSQGTLRPSLTLSSCVFLLTFWNVGCFHSAHLHRHLSTSTRYRYLFRHCFVRHWLPVIAVLFHPPLHPTF